MKPLDKSLSRREFTHKAALTTAVLLGLPELSPAEGNTTPGANTVEPSSTQAPAGAPKLSPQSQAEADSRHQAILAQYPDRFSDTQKIDLRRLCILLQPALDRIRAYSISNGDLPALYLKPLVDRGKKPAATSAKPSVPAKPATGKS